MHAQQLQRMVEIATRLATYVASREGTRTRGEFGEEPNASILRGTRTPAGRDVYEEVDIYEAVSLSNSQQLFVGCWDCAFGWLDVEPL